MHELLFDPSYWLVALAAAAGLVLIYLGLSQLRKPLTRAGWAVLIVSLAWGVAAYFVETPREAALRGTREFVAAVVSGDTATQSKWLSPEASCFQLNKQGILEAARIYIPQYGIKEASLLGLQAAEQGETVTVTFRCWAELSPDNKPGQTIPTDWKFTFFKYEKETLLQRIDYLGMGNGTSSDTAQFNAAHFSESLNKQGGSSGNR